jgi:phage protein D
MTFPLKGIEIYAPNFKLKMIDQNVTIPNGDITSLEIVEELNESGKFEISFNDVLDMKSQKFKWLDNKLILPGNLIDISLNYASISNDNKLTFIGRIKKITPQFAFNSNATLQVIGFDLSHDLKASQKGGTAFDKKKYSQIIEEIASANGLKTGNIQQTETVESVSKSSDQDDYKFIEKLTSEIGFEFFVRGKSLYFRKPKENEDASIIFTNGINILSFSPQISISTYVNEVECNNWDSNKKEKNSQTAKQEDIIKDSSILNCLKNQKDKKIILENKNVSSPEVAKILATAELKKRAENLITGTLESVGNPSIRPGMTVKVEKVGELFNGVYYVKKTTHSIKQKGYTTILELRRCL